MTKSDIIKEYLLNNNEHFSTSDNQAYYIANTKKQFENNRNPFSLKGMNIAYTDSQIKSLKSKSMIWEQYRQKYIQCV
ncbi:MAG: hypothetical protein GX225_05075 [Clostridiales bacterium]|jgi:hypothetical protein|nr:hypothetical protein [Clostridiales bacterium]